jgi:putative exporter of polyketide antibiotics
MIGPFAIRGRRYRNQMRKSRRRFVPAAPSGSRAAGGTTLMWISNVLQNAMIGPDNSITGGLVGASTIFFLNGVVARVTFHSRSLEESTRAELHAAIREAGFCNVAEARFVVWRTPAASPPAP